MMAFGITLFFAANAAEDFLLADTPIWLALAAILISLASAAFAFISTRDAAILRAPDFEIVYDDTQTEHGDVRFRIWNRGKVDAFDVKIEWDYDPLGLRHDKASWSAKRIRAGEYHVATIGFTTEAIWLEVQQFTDPGNKTANGKLMYRSQLTWFRRVTTKRVSLPVPDETFRQGLRAVREAQEALHRERSANNPPAAN